MAAGLECMDVVLLLLGVLAACVRGRVQEVEVVKEERVVVVVC